MHLLALLAIAIPIVAYPFSAATLERPDVIACARLLAGGSVERGAFLTLREDGAFGCRVWREPGELRRVSWHGRIPDGTVAVMHSHPPDAPQPSAHDYAEAERLDAPVIVVCRGRLSVALPGKNSARERSVSDVYTLAPDETASNRQPDTWKTSPLSHEGSRAHP